MNGVKTIEEKRNDIREERIRRYMNQDNISEDEARRRVLQEEYQALPLENRFEMFRGQVRKDFGSVTEFFKGITKDITDLQANDLSLGSAIDIYFLALSKILQRMGIPAELMDECYAQAKAEYEEKLKKEVEERDSARKAAEAAAIAAEQQGKPESILQEAEKGKLAQGAEENRPGPEELYGEASFFGNERF